MRWACVLLLWGCGGADADGDEVVDGAVSDGAGDARTEVDPDAEEAAPDAGVDARAGPDAGEAPDGATDLPEPRFLSLPPTPAGPLWGYMVADVGDDTAYVFGGTNANAGGGDVFDTVRRLDANSELPSLAPVEVGGGPGARYCGCAAWDPVRRRAIVSGGRDLRELFDDTWVFDPAGPSWTPIEAEERPDGGLGCALVYVAEEDAFYHFGGASMARGSNGEMWRLDAEALTWRKLAAEGPRARYDAELLALPGGDILMLGGGDNAAGPFYRDAWRFSPADEAWTMIETEGDSPPGRRIPWIVLDSPTTVLFGFGNGGMSPADYYADLWRLDYVSGEWTELDFEGPGRRSFARWLPGGQGALGLLLGGFDGRIPLNEQWLLMRR